MIDLMSNGDEFYVSFTSTNGTEVRVIFDNLGDVGGTVKRLDLIQSLSRSEAVEFGQWLIYQMTPSDFSK